MFTVALVLGFTLAQGGITLKGSQQVFYTCDGHGSCFVRDQSGTEIPIALPSPPEPRSIKILDPEIVQLREENAKLKAAARDNHLFEYLLFGPLGFLTLLAAATLIASRFDKIVGAWRRAEISLPKLVLPPLLLKILSVLVAGMMSMVFGKYIVVFMGFLSGMAIDAGAVMTSVSICGFVGSAWSVVYVSTRD